MQARLIITLAGISILSACYQDRSTVEDISIIDAALRPYFKTFEAEAAARGILIDASFDEIEGYIEQINDGNVIGQCWYNSQHPNEIRIDQEYWQSVGTIGRELVVFHELGHCYLGRDHTEATTSNGNCVSIMASGTGSCRNRYNQVTREAYLDELFWGE